MSDEPVTPPTDDVTPEGSPASKSNQPDQAVQEGNSAAQIHLGPEVRTAIDATGKEIKFTFYPFRRIRPGGRS